MRSKPLSKKFHLFSKLLLLLTPFVYSEPLKEIASTEKTENKGYLNLENLVPKEIPKEQFKINSITEQKLKKQSLEETFEKNTYGIIDLITKGLTEKDFDYIKKSWPLLNDYGRRKLLEEMQSKYNLDVHKENFKPIQIDLEDSANTLTKEQREKAWYGLHKLGNIDGTLQADLDGIKDAIALTVDSLDRVNVNPGPVKNFINGLISTAEIIRSTADTANAAYKSIEEHNIYSPGETLDITQKTRNLLAGKRALEDRSFKFLRKIIQGDLNFDFDLRANKLGLDSINLVIYNKPINDTMILEVYFFAFKEENAGFRRLDEALEKTITSSGLGTKSYLPGQIINQE
ncbi:hypothetical protein HY498_02780 [Candidatus Woesearchaeota archaeon]|nr:hypothetical protein [Candidatus Woesearchaeota archaeon]